jgi:hypothetical protein
VRGKSNKFAKISFCNARVSLVIENNKNSKQTYK